tara:strand:+ start:569 stop:748 length:180 start_codon:yes stop_codon:yes gene_type:complete
MKDKTGEDFDIAEILFLAPTQTGQLKFRVEVLFDGNTDTAVEKARDQLKSVCRQILEGE